ncbi:ferrochelatase [Rhizorhapis suberifaciens]|uniref:Ferrochelatase n=1 Tax=Rhizorhapis suberifaciens TaxID=13656 RepID=A0A840HUC3_9SPHN|nr:ferrochelatase [Rhizorhapis suberifaciens]MBB4641190.1 ferrochelatase [Rhizorhapis suberifaciens]
MALPDNHPQTPLSKTGLLLINLGTPDAPEPQAVKRYLRQFLSDPRVIEIPPLLWQPILRGIILNVRPKKSAHAYAQIWGPEGSPLATITRDQAEALQAHMGEDLIVDWAMRYGNPSIESRLGEMAKAGCDRILIAPLYPQYCAATTASVQDEVYRVLGTMRRQPAIRTLPPYHDDPAYIGALRSLIERQLAALDFTPEVLLASFHGMPQRTLDLGDPYHCHCQKTARLLSQALGRELMVSFQSRFGRAKWLTPATDAIIVQLAKQGVRHIAVTTPGFSADCIETLEEIALRAEEIFLRNGGEKFAFLPCLNAEEEAIVMYGKILGRELSGWWPRR